MKVYCPLTSLKNPKALMIMKQSIALTPKNFAELVKLTGNIYETTVIISKRAKQISLQTKEELNAKFAEFESRTDNLEEVFENEEHIEISKYYEKQPKPTVIATEEFLAGEIVYRYFDEEPAPSI